MDPIENTFIAIGGNRHPQAADWSPHGTFAFGAGRCIALWNPSDPSLQGVSSALKAHSDKVNVVRFLPNQPQADEIILSGSVDHSVIIWRGSFRISFSLVAKIEGVHKGSINAVATCIHHPSLFATAAADGTVALHSIQTTPTSVTVTTLQTLETKPKFFALSLALSGLPGSEEAVILAVAGSTHAISVYTSESPSKPFSLHATLSGHENWIRSLAFTYENPGSRISSLLLASASQDRYIRLWRIHYGEELPAAVAQSESKTFGLSTRLSNKAHIIKNEAGMWSITFEALLMGHEDWIFTSIWNPKSQSLSDLRLLSCSADNSICVWGQEEESGTWNPISRFGELSNLKGASIATGSAGGIWSCLWGPDGKMVVALTKSGAWRVWRYDSNSDRWTPAVGITGHNKDVTGISWAPDGSYLLSTSLDQTTRLYSRWTIGGHNSWHEFSRPQVHGYDINCIASVGTNRFVSGAEEKLLRVFDEPRAIAESLEHLCGIESKHGKESLPDAASLPVLGLSNKPIEPEAKIEDLAEDEPLKPKPSAPDTPPTEDVLSRLTLWPETEKLYGHGYEISALCSSPNSPFVATACKASTLEHAVIRLYDGSQNWTEIKPPLQSHALTVTSMAFSPSGGRLLSVGRDRAWSVFSAQDDTWKLQERRDKAHTRIVYDCAWIPGDDDRVFVTASRDKSIKIWVETDGKWESRAVVKFTLPVTAVDVLGDVVNDKCWMMAGLEDGNLELYAIKNGEWDVMEKSLTFDSRVTPDKQITELTWRPGSAGDAREIAVASEDSSVRIFKVQLV